MIQDPNIIYFKNFLEKDFLPQETRNQPLKTPRMKRKASDLKQSN